MQKWEYLHLQGREIKDKIMEKLDEHGKVGWELVSAERYASSDFFDFFLKRPID